MSLLKERHSSHFESREFFKKYKLTVKSETDIWDLVSIEMAIFGNWENLVRHGAHALPPKLSIAISSRHREHFLSLAIQNFYDSDLPLDEVSWMIRQYLLLCKDRDYSLKMGNQTEARVFGKAA